MKKRDLCKRIGFMVTNGQWLRGYFLVGLITLSRTIGMLSWLVSIENTPLLTVGGSSWLIIHLNLIFLIILALTLITTLLSPLIITLLSLSTSLIWLIIWLIMRLSRLTITSLCCLSTVFKVLNCSSFLPSIFFHYLSPLLILIFWCGFCFWCVYIQVMRAMRLQWLWVCLATK